MKKVIALGGSNSSTSINKALATYVAGQIDSVERTILDLNDFDLPIYGIDREKAQGIPEEAQRLNAIIEAADGLIISLAEHNHAYSTAFKNAYDWLSRIDKNVWKHKPMLLMATSPGGRGGANVLEVARTSFPRLGGNIVAEFSLPSFHRNFSAEGIKDEALKKTLENQIAAFVAALG